MQQAFRGRKKDPTQNMMVAANCDMKFTYVLAGWEGSAHDATVLADAVAREDGLSLPKGFGIDEVVPDEEGFTASADPTNLPPAHLDQDSVDMTEIRDAICNAMWKWRGTNTI
ncbi:uncharacterized protein [Miscanthus floridulus]|uniref:uncharacterized protein n=1 Tax=Miscanthus floridulus TaxID=154761 RepID=UPI0034594237